MIHYLNLEPKKIFIAFRHPLLCMPSAATEKKTLLATLNKMFWLKNELSNKLVVLLALLNPVKIVFSYKHITISVESVLVIFLCPQFDVI